jgi:hypothetical protein
MEADRQELIDTMALVAKINEDTKVSNEIQQTQQMAIKRTALGYALKTVSYP